MKWSWSDAWLLTAAYFTEENPVTLRSLFAAGDAINHAIFTDVEIDHGLTRLEAAGLAHLDGEAIVLTDDAIHLCEEAVKSTPYMFESTQKVEGALRKIDLAGREFKPVDIPKDAVRRALEQYQEDAAREIPELRSSEFDA